MSIHPELTLENCRSIPTSRITYLQEGIIYAEFKNNSESTIEIKEIMCQFQTEKGLRPYISSVTPMVSIRSNNRSTPIQIPFFVDLSIKEETNLFVLIVKYSKDGSSDLSWTFTYPFTSYLIIDPIRLTKKHFFISHKDPENSHHATKLDYHLKKIGFKGFIAEAHKKPGSNFWDEKIFPAIDTCVALIILWTVKAIAEKKAILRELNYAKKKNKTVILVIEKGIEVPDSFSGKIEYYRLKSNISECDLISLVKVINDEYINGKY